tara:strand:- start:255 stop:419 length:165 start_codon:yes stop_codon:yes gene_type:complete
MRVYVPNKRTNAINDILKELYLLRQAIDHQASTVDSRLKMIDKIRNQIQSLEEE